MSGYLVKWLLVQKNVSYLAPFALLPSGRLGADGMCLTNLKWRSRRRRMTTSHWDRQEFNRRLWMSKRFRTLPTHNLYTRYASRQPEDTRRKARDYIAEVVHA